MATAKFFGIPATGGGASSASAVSLSIATTAVSAIQTVGHNQIVRFVSNGGVNIRFGTTGITTATGSDYYLPAGVIDIIDMGRFNESFIIYNPAGTTVNVWYSILGRM